MRKTSVFIKICIAFVVVVVVVVEQVTNCYLLRQSILDVIASCCGD